MKIEVKLPAKLEQVFTGPAMYRVAYGGRGSGKSVGFARMAILRAIQSPIRILCARELQNSIKDSVHNLLVGEIENMGLQSAFTWGESFLRCKNGSEFIFKGLRTNTSEIKSMNNIALCWVEEAQAVSEKSLELLLPTVRGKGAEIWFTFNPEDDHDPVYRDFVLNADADCSVVKINWEDNPWFPEFLDKQRRKMQEKNPSRYDYVWNGNFNINTEGSVYGKWIAEAEKLGRFRKALYDPGLPVNTAWDIGYSDYTTIWFFQATGGELRLIDYYENNREGISHYCSQLAGYEFVNKGAAANGRLLYERGEPIEGLEHRRKYRYGKHWVPHDAAHKLFAANGRSIVEQANDLGFRMFVVASISQQNQIAIARKSIEQAWFDPDMCAEGIRALRKYEFQFDDDKQRYKDVPFHNWASHGSDAFELCGQVWKNEVKPEEGRKPRFLHDMTANELFWPEAPGISRERI